ncbi:MAG: right-handed parallel beta-helix repeat-containing protein [Phycisphaerae bacterium]|nr:right-handed parallel beta-helix repeat-containing protein [Phycisphaerae bacterium]
MRLNTIRAATVMVALAVTASATAAVRYVDAGAPVGGDGLSWATAYRDLQAALAAASANPAIDELWVAEGRYVPSATDATLSFVLKNGLAIYGGFAGNETSRSQRDWSAHPTILDGDIGGDDVVGSGAFWYVGWATNSANSGHVVNASGTDGTAILDGFTLANGNTGPVGTPAGDPLMFGGGVYCVNGSPTIRHCTFTHCLAAFAAGAGLYLYDSNATVIDCAFVENYCHLARGAGIYVGGESQPVIEDCVFTHNVVVAGQPDSQGGGIATWSTSPMAIRRCDFVENVAKPFSASGNIVAYGGGLFSFNKPLLVADCRFLGNSATTGGGASVFGATTFVNCLFHDNKAVVQPNSPNPELGGDGAAISFYSLAPNVSSIRNCTIASNDGKKYAVMQWFSGSYVVENSIVWGNTATDPEVAGGYKTHLGGSFDVAYSCVATIFDPPAPGEDPIDPENLPGCIDTAPMFVGASDLHLAPSSPCIDAGSNALVPVGVTLDLDGNARFADDPSVRDTGLGAAPVVDMGCFERAATPPCVAADFDCDGVVGGADLAILLGAWGSTGGAADLNASGSVDGADLALLLGQWG